MVRSAAVTFDASTERAIRFGRTSGLIMRWIEKSTTENRANAACTGAPWIAKNVPPANIVTINTGASLRIIFADRPSASR